MESSTLVEPLLILSILIEGRWIEHTYRANDPEWKDALKIACKIGAAVRFAYKQGNQLTASMNSTPALARG